MKTLYFRKKKCPGLMSSVNIPAQLVKKKRLFAFKYVAYTQFLLLSFLFDFSFFGFFRLVAELHFGLKKLCSRPGL